MILTKNKQTIPWTSITTKTCHFIKKNKYSYQRAIHSTIALGIAGLVSGPQTCNATLLTISQSSMTLQRSNVIWPILCLKYHHCYGAKVWPHARWGTDIESQCKTIKLMCTAARWKPVRLPMLHQNLKLCRIYEPQPASANLIWVTQ